MFLILDKARTYTSRTYFQAYLRTLLEIILRPLSGLSWNTDIIITKELRLGCFSIRQLSSLKYIFLEFKTQTVNNHNKVKCSLSVVYV